MTKMPNYCGPFEPPAEQAIRVQPTGQPRSVDDYYKTCSRRDWTGKSLSTDAKSLIVIRKKLGMTQADFALALDIPKDRLINIENGRAKKISEDILANARALMDAEGTRVQSMGELDTLSMREILDRWWGIMGATSDEEGAILLGTSMVTIKRWLSGEDSKQGMCRPSRGDLLRYEAVAKRMADRGFS